MSSSSDIVVVGSHAPGIFLKVKRVPKAGETVIGWDFLEPKDGGKGSNQAISIGLLGGKVSFVGCVGRDRIGKDGETWMQEAHVDTTWLRHHERVASGVGFIILDDNGIPAMVTSLGANAEISTKQIDDALTAIKDAKISLTQFEIPLETAMYAARKAHELGMQTIINPAPAPEHQVEGLGIASFLVPNESEALVLIGKEAGSSYDEEELVNQLRKKSGAECVIITLGDKGIIGMDQDGRWKIAPPKVNVVDTSGAGDVFCAALAVGLVNGKDVRSASDWACKAASLSVTKAGTIPSYPTLNEVNDFIISIDKK